MAKYYTGIGDNGTSTFYGSAERHPKNDPRFEALGALDELNSYLGVCKTHADTHRMEQVLEGVQQDLFIIQAEVGTDKPSVSRLGEEKIRALEARIANLSDEIGEIRTFILAGGTKLSAHLDYARALARKTERHLIPIQNSIGAPTYAYLNRLSSLLFVLARVANKTAGANESGPRYQ